MDLKEFKKQMWDKASLWKKVQIMFWYIFWKIRMISTEIKIIRAIRKAEKHGHNN